ncbi:hypothetical protein Q1695_003175 [Nippostrongylus brasiliensis]|nr:hypothetical protein Q1695_003175 [Nippostrongylus brasiliensis]
MQRAPQVLRRPSSKFYDQFNGYAPSRGLTIPPIRVVVEFTYCSDTLQLIYTDPYYISLTSSITAHKQTSTATIHIVVDIPSAEAIQRTTAPQTTANINVGCISTPSPSKKASTNTVTALLVVSYARSPSSFHVMRTNSNTLLRGTAAICLLVGMVYPGWVYPNQAGNLFSACFVSRKYTYKSGKFEYGSLTFGGTDEEVNELTYCRLTDADGTQVDVLDKVGDFGHQEGKTYAITCYCRAKESCNTLSTTFHKYVTENPQVFKSMAFKDFWETYDAERKNTDFLYR